jgi:hypothetical protein
MNSERHRSDNQNDADKYLRQIDDTYVFDEASGIYRPVSRAKEQETANRKRVEIEPQPLGIHVRRDWIDLTLKFFGFVVSVGTLGLLVLTVLYAYKQWQEANRSANAAECTARIAQDSLRNQEQSFITDQRAWVGLGNATCEKCSNAMKSINVSEPKFFILNTGKTPALHVRVEAYPIVKIYKILEPPPTFEEAKNGKQYSVIFKPSEYTAPPGIPVEIYVPMFGSSTASDQPFYYVVGRMTYFDIYQPKMVHHTAFCIMTGDKFPFGGPLTWHLCSQGNSMD